MKIHLAIIALVLLVLVCGCAERFSSSSAGGSPWLPQPATHVTTRIIPVAAATAAPTVTPEATDTPHSIYMYSTARGMKYHEAGFVCTNPGGAADMYQFHPNGTATLIGIWCEN
jgi:hypothetical protein